MLGERLCSFFVIFKFRHERAPVERHAACFALLARLLFQDFLALFRGIEFLGNLCEWSKEIVVVYRCNLHTGKALATVGSVFATVMRDYAFLYFFKTNQSKRGLVPKQGVKRVSCKTDCYQTTYCTGGVIAQAGATFVIFKA